ncbi:MAG: exosortase/archaeosortase family protein [Planctomycetaceae bacterium]|jgi:exosortase|nr:exosortase/archaeosortase family protein [Planctomycetaceae bacterium]
MAERNKNSGSQKTGRFDIPITPEQNNNPTNVNNANNANDANDNINTSSNNLSKNKFSFDSPASNINNPMKSRVGKFNEINSNFADSPTTPTTPTTPTNPATPTNSTTPAESKFDQKQPSSRFETRPKNVGGKFAMETDDVESRQTESRKSQFTNNNNDNDNDNPSMQTMHTIQTKTQSQVESPKPSASAFKKYLLPIDVKFETLRLGLLLLLVLPLTIYSYYMALEQIVYSWINNVDYSHGFFVVPLVILFLYSRLDSYPGTRYRLCWLGLIPIVFCLVMRYFFSLIYADALEEWSLFFWVIGIVWFFYGTRAFLWALPSLCFLIFMFQLPYSIDVLMKHHLQLYAARFAAILLQILGEPAIAINNIIRVKGEILSVEAACSGIRFLISVFAIAAAAALFMRKPWWQNLIVMLIAAPLAMFVNALRITMTGILLIHHRAALAQIVPKERVNAFADEIAGYTMIVVVAVTFLCLLIFMDKVFKRVNI